MLMLFKTPVMVSFTRASGSLMVQLGRQIAGFCAFEAGSDEERPVDGVDHLEGRDLSRIPGERVAAVHAGMRAQEAHLGKPLKNLGQELGGDSVGVSNVLGAQGRASPGALRGT